MLAQTHPDPPPPTPRLPSTTARATTTSDRRAPYHNRSHSPTRTTIITPLLIPQPYPHCYPHILVLRSLLRLVPASVASISSRPRPAFSLIPFTLSRLHYARNVSPTYQFPSPHPLPTSPPSLFVFVRVAFADPLVFFRLLIADRSWPGFLSTSHTVVSPKNPVALRFPSFESLCVSLCEGRVGMVGGRAEGEGRRKWRGSGREAEMASEMGI